MRAALNLDDDGLASAKVVAAQQGPPVGEVVSDLLRKSLEPIQFAPPTRNGIPLFPVKNGAQRVTSEIVQRLLNETE